MNKPIFGPLPYMIRVQKLVLTPKAKQWCALPYYDKKHGCPNYRGRCYEGGKRRIVMLNEIMNVHQPIYIVYNEFDLAAHMAKMLEAHPNWSERQQRNVYYWQNQSRTQLQKKVDAAAAILRQRGPIIISSGEGNGVNLYATCFHSGLKLEKIRRLKICRHLVLIGTRLRSKKTASASGPTSRRLIV